MSIRRLLVAPPGTAAASKNKYESQEPEAFAIRNENQKHSSRAHKHNSSHDGDPEESPRLKAMVMILLEKNSFLKSAVKTLVIPSAARSLVLSSCRAPEIPRCA